MKILLLFPSVYSIDKTLKTGFQRLGHEVFLLDYRNIIESWKNKFNVQIFRFPNRIREKWNLRFFNSVNEKILIEYDKINPDIVMVYNNEMLLPETVIRMKLKSKLIFFLGDNPYYTQTNNHNLTILFHADIVVCPDSFWKKQLELLGLSNVCFEVPGFNEETNSPVVPDADEIKKYQSDIFFCGNSYIDSWGFKRALFLSKFVKFHLKFYGNHTWERWFGIFPELRNSFNLQTSPMSFEMLNLLSNCTKVYPVDANPGILNGLHVRIFDCIAGNVLPLAEYRDDISTVFKDIEIPLIKNYNEAESVARKYISNDSLRLRTLADLREYVFSEYKPEHIISRILNRLG